MRRWQKAVTTIWTTLLVAPILWFALAYFGMECSEIDPCPTGGQMPHAAAALLSFIVVAALHLAFLAMIWRAVPAASG